MKTFNSIMTQNKVAVRTNAVQTPIRAQVVTKRMVDREAQVYFIIWTSMGWSYSRAKLTRMFSPKKGIGFQVEGSSRVFKKSELFASKEQVMEALRQLRQDTI